MDSNLSAGPVRAMTCPRLPQFNQYCFIFGKKSVKVDFGTGRRLKIFLELGEILKAIRDRILA